MDKYCGRSFNNSFAHRAYNLWNLQTSYERYYSCKNSKTIQNFLFQRLHKPRGNRRNEKT